MNTCIIIFAEDPGAANYLSYCFDLLTGYRNRVLVLASEKAAGYFQRSGIEVLQASTFISAEQVLATFSPDLIIAGTSENRNSLGLYLIQSAKKRQIKSVGVVDMGMNAAFRFKGDSSSPLGYAPEWLIVPDQWTCDEYISLGYPHHRIRICGHPHYDYVRGTADRLNREGRTKLRANLFGQVSLEKNVIVFAAEISDGLNSGQFFRSDEYTLNGTGASVKRTDIVIEEFLAAVSQMPVRPYLVLRLHPKNDPKEFGPYIKAFDQISIKEDVLKIVYAADGVVGMTSMLLLEAAIMGVATFSILPREVELQWLPSIGAGLTKAVTTRRELEVELPLFFDNLAAENLAARLDDAFVFNSGTRLRFFFSELL
jgi:hypothetical protein